MKPAEVRRATAADLKAFYGAPPKVTVQAWVGIVEGKIIAVGGLTYFAGKPHDCFLDVTEEARKRPLEIVRAGRMMVRELRGTPARVVADPDEPKSGRLLTLIGFKPIGVRGGMEVFSTW